MQGNTGRTAPRKGRYRAGAGEVWRLSCRFCRDELSQERGFFFTGAQRALCRLRALDVYRTGQGLQAPLEWAHIEWTRKRE